ncbi:hypothetical protein [Erythrobacter litoralis]|jgi:hypothetical protein|nr:hypothetical protein [Erythrobacter litoralis]
MVKVSRVMDGGAVPIDRDDPLAETAARPVSPCAAQVEESAP